MLPKGNRRLCLFAMGLAFFCVVFADLWYAAVLIAAYHAIIERNRFIGRNTP